MFRDGLLGQGLGTFFSKQEPQSLFKQFYDLRVFLVGYPYTYCLQYLVVHRARLKKDDAEIWSLLNTVRDYVRYLRAIAVETVPEVFGTDSKSAAWLSSRPA